MKQYPKYPAYKESGVEWLGKIPTAWGIRRMKYVFKETNIRSMDGQEDLLSVSQYTGVTKKSDKTGVGELLTNAESLEGYKKVEKGDLVSNIMLAWNGSLGFSPHSGITSPAYSIYRVTTEDSKKFLHYLLRTDIYKSEFKRNSSGVIDSRLRLYTEDFFAITVLLPSPGEQTAIADFLDDKTAKIEKAIAQKERLIALLKERKQIIIQNAVTKGLDPKVKMKDSGIEWIGEIPEHWEVVKNRTLFLERNQPGKAGLPILSVSIHSGVSDEELSDEENLRGKIRIEDKTSYKLVKTEDVAYNMMRAWQGGIGRVPREGMVSPAYVVVIPSPRIDAAYFENQYRLPLFIQEMNRASKGITDFRKRLYWNEFKQLSTLVPPFEEQEKIVAFLVKIEAQLSPCIDSLKQQIQKLREYRATLIDSAVTGKIKVPGI